MVSYYNTSQTEKLETQHIARSKVLLCAKVVEPKFFRFFSHFLIQMCFWLGHTVIVKHCCTPVMSHYGASLSLNIRNARLTSFMTLKVPNFNLMTNVSLPNTFLFIPEGRRTHCLLCANNEGLVSSIASTRSRCATSSVDISLRGGAICWLS